MYGKVTVTDTATLVCSKGGGGPETVLRNTGSVACYVGSDDAVTDADGMLLEPGDVMGFFGDCAVYAITSSSTTTLSFFKAG